MMVSVNTSRTPGEQVAEEWITLTEIAKRVNERDGWENITRQGVTWLADNDRTWPVAASRPKWRKVGPSWTLPWKPVERYFTKRAQREGPDDT